MATAADRVHEQRHQQLVRHLAVEATSNVAQLAELASGEDQIRAEQAAALLREVGANGNRD
jgi:hypothetical protein